MRGFLIIVHIVKCVVVFSDVEDWEGVLSYMYVNIVLQTLKLLGRNFFLNVCESRE